MQNGSHWARPWALVPATARIAPALPDATCTSAGDRVSLAACLLEATVLADELNDETLLSFVTTTLQQEQQAAPEGFTSAWRELTGGEPPDLSVEDSFTCRRHLTNRVAISKPPFVH